MKNLFLFKDDTLMGHEYSAIHNLKMRGYTASRTTYTSTNNKLPRIYEKQNIIHKRQTKFKIPPRTSHFLSSHKNKQFAAF